jgi:hypothetical protein
MVRAVIIKLARRHEGGLEKKRFEREDFKDLFYV